MKSQFTFWFFCSKIELIGQSTIIYPPSYMITKKALSEFFRSSPTPIVVLLCDVPKFTIIDVNDVYLATTGTSRAKLVGKGIFEAFPVNENDPQADGFKNLAASFATVIATKKSHSVPCQKQDIASDSDSQLDVKYWKIDNMPLLGDEGEVNMIVHTIVDISEKVLSKQKIAEAQFAIDKGNELLQQTESLSKLGRWEIDRRTNQAFWSDSHYTMLGYAPQEFEITLEKTLELLHPDDRVMMIQHFEEALKELQEYKVEFRFVAKDQSVINILCRGKFVFDEDGNLIKQVGVVQDVTDVKNAEEAAKKTIAESNERFEYVAKATFDAIWDWDLATDSIYWGDGFETIFEHKMATLATNSSGWTDNIHPDDVDRIVESFYSTIKSSATNWTEEYQYKKGNGEYSFVVNKGILTRGDDGRAKRIIGAMQDVTKHKEEEQHLKLLESVITNATDAVMITEAEPFDEPGPKVVFVNEAFTKMTGYTAEEVIGKTPRILQGPKSDKDELEKLSKALRRWEPCEATLLNYKKSGEEFWINMVLSPVANEKGWFTHWIAIERDVTQKKLREHQLKLLESVVINTTDGIVIKKPNTSLHDGREIIYINDAFAQMTGYSKDEMVGKTFKMLRGPNTDLNVLEQFYKQTEALKQIEITLIFYKKTGEQFWANLTLNAVTNDLDIITHWVVILRDVTEQKNQEQKIIEINQKLVETLESIQDGFYTLDAGWNINYWNKAAEIISGRSHKEVMGLNILNFYERQISTQVYSKFLEAKEQKKPVRLEIYSDQLKKWFEFNAFPSTFGLTVYFKDISDRKGVESKLKKMNLKLESNIKKLAILNAELEQFAYVASHDLQEPLRMVTSFLTQIENKYNNVLDDKGKKYIYFAVDGAKRMRQIILDILEFSRIGKSDNNLEEINLNEVLNETCLLFGRKIKDKNAKIIYQDLPKIVSYAAPIKQIFHNLIGNGLKYSDASRSPELTISCQETAHVWKFVLQDNGIGIEAESFDKIFELFQRLHNKDEYSGTGIGLAITKKIIENLGGQIGVISEVGVGSKFHFSIPKKTNKKRMIKKLPTN